MQDYKHVVMFSGGIGSWMAARRVADEFGTENLTLLFADTLIEDKDLYRFINDAAANIGVPLTRLCDGRTPWELMRQVRFIGNSRVDPCSLHLKRKLLDKWRNENCTPNNTIIYVGIDWTECHRLEKLRKRVVPWIYKAPMCQYPWVDKPEMLRFAKSNGLDPPSLYAKGFAHNNCGGKCIKAGKAQWALLYKTNPSGFYEVEEWENSMRIELGYYSILYDIVDKKKIPLPLSIFRHRIETGNYDRFEWGGCGCALE